MAKKDEQEFSYGSSHLPSGERKYSVIRWGWNGLNQKDDIDTGQLTDMSGIVCDPPYMIPQKKPKVWLDFEDGVPISEVLQTEAWVKESSRDSSGVPISIAGFDDILYMVWEDTQPTTGKHQIHVSKYQFGRHTSELDTRFRSYRRVDALTDGTANIPRSIVQFNVVTDPTTQDDTLSGNIVNYTYDRKTLVYPDCVSVPYSWEYLQSTAPSFNDPQNPVPVSDVAAVYGSRVFGATRNAVFSSAYNSYVDYSLDTADDVSSAHAWWSMTQSNTEANGAVTAIASFDNHVVIFRKDFMQLVYNNKNPFRIVDVGAFGCVSNKARTILNGVLYFASQDKIYAFTGGTPKEISKKLEIDNFENAVLGSYNDTLWLWANRALYTYKDGTWSFYGDLIDEEFQLQIKQFATLDFGLAALVDCYNRTTRTHYDQILLFDWDESYFASFGDSGEWQPEYMDEWYFVTDLMILGKLDVRRIKKLSLLCEGVEDADVTVRLIDDENPRSETVVAEHEFDSDGIKVLRVLTRQFSGTMHRLRISGHGYVKIYAAEIKLSWGGDIYVTT